MKYVKSVAFLALVTPVITLGSVAVLAEQTTPSVTQDRRATESALEKAEDRLSRKDQYRRESRGYLESVPKNGIKSASLIGAEVRTGKEESVGPLTDLIIDESGQIVAVVVGVGGFLGIGEKDVAIGWDDVSIKIVSGTPKLRIEASRENLLSAPEFEADL